MRKLDLAYLAGVMDSDGSFSIGIERWRERVLGRTPTFQEIVAVGQCDEQAIRLLKELFGGATRTEKPRGPRRRAMCYWQATNKIAVAATRALLPFLRIKRRQAETILALRKIKDRGRKANTDITGPSIRRMKPEVVAEMYALACEIRKHNDTRSPLPLRQQE